MYDFKVCSPPQLKSQCLESDKSSSSISLSLHPLTFKNSFSLVFELDGFITGITAWFGWLKNIMNYKWLTIKKYNYGRIKIRTFSISVWRNIYAN